MSPLQKRKLLFLHEPDRSQTREQQIDALKKVLERVGIKVVPSSNRRSPSNPDPETVEVEGEDDEEIET